MRNLKRLAAVLLSGIVITGAGLATASPAFAVNTYHYAVGEQVGLVADGAAVNMTVENPFVSSTDGSAHSLAELAVRSSDGKDIVEVGWRKTAGAVPRLFVYHWINGAPQGYNLCTDYAPEPVNANADLSSWVTQPAPGPRFQIVNTGTAWWVAFNQKWVCYLSNTLWSNAGRTFVKANTVQAFGEVVSVATTTPRSDMGDGQFGSSGTAAQIGSYALTNVTSGGPANFNVYTSPASGAYTASVVTPGVTFRYGGAGYSATGTLPGVIGS